MYTQLKNKNIYLNIINSEKFKSLSISFDFNDSKYNIDEKNVAMEAIKVYIESEKMQEKLMRFYGARINTGTIIRNTYISEAISLEALSPEFIRDKNYTIERILSLIPDILKEIIDLSDEEFKEIVYKSVESIYEKSLMKERICGYNLISKFIFNIENNEFNSANRFGKSNNYTKSFDFNSIREIIKNMIYKNTLKLYILGDVNNKQVEDIILNFRDNIAEISVLNRSTKDIENTEILNIKEQGNDFNSNLVLGFALDIGNNNDKYIEMKVLETILGGPEGIFFNELREKNNLAYYVAVQYNILNKMFFISLSLSRRSREIVEKIINYIIVSIQNGQISDKQLEYGKGLYKQCVMESLDTPKGMFVMGEVLEFSKDNCFKDYIKRIENVEKNDIIELAHNFRYKGSYFIEGKG